MRRLRIAACHSNDDARNVPKERGSTGGTFMRRSLTALSFVLLAGSRFALPGFAKPGYTTFAPANSEYTYPVAIDGGAVAGYFADSTGLNHGFVRATNGTITTFDPTGSNGTYVTGMNDAGTITGYYDDANYNGHGFARAADG